MREGMFKVSGDQIFATLQGEGVTAGEPAVFLRLHFCNLACGKNGGWQCDTGYTWDTRREDFWKEPIDWSIAQTAENIRAEWEKTPWEEKFQKDGKASKKRVVVTGGEPTLQQAKIIEITKLLPDWAFEIETNGTIAPRPELINCQINCSPKLSNSGNAKERRYKPDVLKAINAMPNSWFKFVALDPKDFEEIDQMVQECGLDPKKILIMPEGYTKDNVDEHRTLVEEEVKKRGWNFTMRNQLIWFGPKRRT